MKEMHELAASYDQALTDFEKTVQDARRQWASRQLSSFPDRQVLEAVAVDLMSDLATDSVEVNAVSDTQQETLVKAPEPVEETRVVPLESSLCVLSVGSKQALQASDIQADPFLATHPARPRGLHSWASAPIWIDGVCAGTVCAMEVEHKRDWTDQDQELLERAAGAISAEVVAWASDKKYKI